MANQYLDQLSEETSPATSDLMLLEQSDTSTENKITILNLLSIIDALTAIDAVAAADELPLYDATASSVKKATITQLGVGLGHVVELPVIEWATACSTGDGKYYFVVPPKYNGLNLTGVHGQVVTPGTTGTMDIQVYNVNRRGDRSLTLRHTQYNRRPLAQSAEEVAKHIARLWGFTVRLESAAEDDKVEVTHELKMEH